MRRPRKHGKNRVALAKGLAWLLVPVLPGLPSCHAPAKATSEVSVCSLDQPALAARLGAFDQLVSHAGLKKRTFSDGLMLVFAERVDVRAKLTRWVDNESECCPAAEWTVSAERELGGERYFVLTLRGSTEVRDYILAHVASVERLPVY
jgi:hypothetical protein